MEKKKGRKVIFGWFRHRQTGGRGGGDTKSPGIGDPNWDEREIPVRLCPQTGMRGKAQWGVPQNWELPVSASNFSFKLLFKNSDLNQNLDLQILGSSKLGPFSELQVPPKPVSAPPLQAGDKDISLSPSPPKQEQLLLLSASTKNPPSYHVLGLFFFLHSNFYFPTNSDRAKDTNSSTGKGTRGVGKITPGTQNPLPKPPQNPPSPALG